MRVGFGHCEEIAAMIFRVVLSLFVVRFSAMLDMLAVERAMLEASASSLSTVGRRVMLAPIKCLLIMVEISETKVLLDRSVSRIEMEWMASSSVLGIFWASVIWSRVVDRLLSIVGWRSGIRFLANKNSRASVGVLTEVLSGSVCWVSWEFVLRRQGLRVGGWFFVVAASVSRHFLGGGLDAIFC